jgi:hypothetical protein
MLHINRLYEKIAEYFIVNVFPLLKPLLSAGVAGCHLHGALDNWNVTSMLCRNL